MIREMVVTGYSFYLASCHLVVTPGVGSALTTLWSRGQGWADTLSCVGVTHMTRLITGLAA